MLESDLKNRLKFVLSETAKKIAKDHQETDEYFHQDPTGYPFFVAAVRSLDTIFSSFDVGQLVINGWNDSTINLYTFNEHDALSDPDLCKAFRDAYFETVSTEAWWVREFEGEPGENFRSLTWGRSISQTGDPIEYIPSAGDEIKTYHAYLLWPNTLEMNSYPKWYKVIDPFDKEHGVKLIEGKE